MPEGSAAAGSRKEAGVRDVLNEDGFLTWWGAGFRICRGRTRASARQNGVGVYSSCFRTSRRSTIRLHCLKTKCYDSSSNFWHVRSGRDFEWSTSLSIEPMMTPRVTCRKEAADV